MRRSEPRPLGLAIDGALGEARPQTVLARVQAAWAGVAGPVVAEESEPVSERAGIVTFRCHSATWAQELELLAPDLLERLRAAVGDGVAGLRFRVS